MFIIKIRKILFRVKIFFVVFIVISILIFISLVIQFEKNFIPTAITFSEKYAVNVISNKINESVQEVIKNFDIYNLNFMETYSNERNTDYLNINNILINDICAEISSSLSKRLSDVKESRISLPIGTLTGIGFFSSFGPSFNIKINSVGNATVDYETKFEAVGVNQINFQVWLQINTQMAVFNNIYSKEINVKRDLMLVNIVFNGEVPNMYINLDEIQKLS